MDVCFCWGSGATIPCGARCYKASAKEGMKVRVLRNPGAFGQSLPTLRMVPSLYKR